MSTAPWKSIKPQVHAYRDDALGVHDAVALAALVR